MSEKPKLPHCDCPLCRRSREFSKQIARLSPAKREYFERLYDHLMNVECELEMVNAAIDSGQYIPAPATGAQP